MGIRLGLRAASIFLAAALGVSAASAATVELTSVTGTFQNPTWNVDYYGIKNKPKSYISGDSQYGAQFIRSENGGSELWWGSTNADWRDRSALTSAEKARQSGYVFDGITASDNFSTTDEVFTFAKATHHNGEVWSNSATLHSVDFKVDIAGKIEGADFSLSAMFRLFHNETINPSQICPAGGSQPCRDAVLINGGVAESIPVIVGNMQYTLILEGLVGSLDGPLVTSFVTDEFKQNSAMFRARLKAEPINPPPVVPLPAAGWLLIAGVGGLVVASRRRRSS